MKYIYIVNREDYEYDEHYSATIIAETLGQCRMLAIKELIGFKMGNFTTTRIGIAYKNIVLGTINESFNAG